MAEKLCGSMDSTDEAGEAAEDRDAYPPANCPLGAGRGRRTRRKHRNPATDRGRDRWEV